MKLLRAAVLIFVVQSIALERARTLNTLELARAAGDLKYACERAGGRDFAGPAGKKLVAVAIPPGAKPLRRTRSIHQLERVGADHSTLVERAAARIVKGYAPKIAGPKDVVLPHLNDFSDALPAAVEAQAAGLRQIGRDCRGAKGEGGRWSA